MSLLGNLFGNLTGNDDSEEYSAKPCTNCSPSCEIYPNACAECQPYKEKLTEILYNVAHLEEFYARYEVASTASASAGATTCPFCGAPNPAGALACEYCGSQLKEGSAKIIVSSAAEIPNPIMEAQNIIFERHEIEKKYSSDNSGSTGLLGSLLGALAGTSDSFGDRMTEEEIKAVAEEYGVPVETYLAGLDNGTYYTKSVKAAKDRAEAQMQAQSQPNYGAAVGVGAAGIGIAGAAMNGNRYGTQAYAYNQQPYGRPPQPPVQGRPPQQQMYGRPQQNPQPPRPAQQNTNAARPAQQQTNNRPAQPVQNAKPSKPAMSSRPQQQAQPARPSQPMNNGRPAQNTGKTGNAAKAQSVSKPASASRPAQSASRPAQSASRPAQSSARPAASRPSTASRPSAPSRPSGGIKKK